MENSAPLSATKLARYAPGTNLGLGIEELAINRLIHDTEMFTKRGNRTKNINTLW